MKLINTALALLFVLSIHSVSYSQKITAGMYSGINFSDIHRQDIGGKWNFKPGPVQGLSLGYSLNRYIGLQSGISFSTIYYEHKFPSVSQPYYPDSFSSIMPVYYQENEMMNFSFVRIPLLFTLTIPSSVPFEMRTGIYYSPLSDYSLNKNYSYSPEPEKPADKDFGYIFSSGISYPFTHDFKAAFNISYITGRKRFIENSAYKHGSSEFTLGVVYTGFHKKERENIIPKPAGDSSYCKVFITYTAGLNISWNSGTDKEKYLPYIGPSIGFSLSVPMRGESFFQTGISFQRKGYSIRDSSNSYYKIISDNNAFNFVNTKVETDYAIIPFLLCFPLEKSHRVLFNTGPWLGLKLNARNVGVAYNASRSGTSYTLRKTIVYDDLEKLFRGYDIGWNFGCSTSFPLFESPYKLSLALQYSTGFMNVYDNSYFENGQNMPVKEFVIRNGTISFLVGLKIPPIGRKN